MNFKSYAISQKIKRNSDLIKYINKDEIPLSVIETEFKDVFDSYKDEEAEMLAENYEEYLVNYAPVSFSPTKLGLDVHGNIKDEVLEVIEAVHNVKKEHVVKTLVTNVIGTVAPEREFDVQNITFNERLEKIQNRMKVQNDNIDNVKHEIKTDVNDVEHLTAIEKKTYEVFDAVDNDKVLDIVVNDNNEDNKTVVNIEDTVDKSFNTDISNILTDIYNQVMIEVEKLKIDERIPLDNDLYLAI